MSISPLFVLMVSCLFLFQHCTQPTTGCRDITATNYNVTADEDCTDNCCTYPLLKIKFSQQIQQTVFGVDSIMTFRYNNFYTLPNTPLDSFAFQKIQCYFSDFRLVDANGVERKIEEEITLGFEDVEVDSVTVSEDMFVFNASSSTTFNVGTMRNTGTFEGIKFKVGLVDEILQTNIITAPTSSLEYFSDSLNYREGIGYISQNYIYFNEPMAVDSTVVFREESVEIELPSAPFTVLDGYNTTLFMTVRYDKWLENIDLKTTSAQDFETNIVSNLPNAFTLDSLQYN